tara:strand:- start:7051 stop:7533 length:483 start_codon:yes stop_codon:yes gene_type:complete
MIDEQTLMETHWRETIADYDVPQTIILARHLGVDMDDAQSYIDSEDYLVLTDEEADEHVREEIEEMVWAFSPSFLSVHTRVAEEAIRKIQESMCEDANESLTTMIKDFDWFVEDAVRYDGRGHFLAGYDHNESEEIYASVVRDGRCYKVEQNAYYIYRRN